MSPITNKIVIGVLVIAVGGGAVIVISQKGRFLRIAPTRWTYSVNGSTVQVAETAREFRLRDGNTVLNIYNLGYNTVGGNPGTGTTSPEVQRLISDNGSDNAGGAP